MVRTNLFTGFPPIFLPPNNRVELLYWPTQLKPFWVPTVPPREDARSMPFSIPEPRSVFVSCCCVMAIFELGQLVGYY